MKIAIMYLIKGSSSNGTQVSRCFINLNIMLSMINKYFQEWCTIEFVLFTVVLSTSKKIFYLQVS